MKNVFFSNAIWDDNKREAALQRCRDILHDDVEDINAELFRCLLPESRRPYDLAYVEHPEKLRTIFSIEAVISVMWICGKYTENRLYSDLIYMSKGWNDSDNKDVGNSVLALSLARNAPIIFDNGTEPTDETVEYFRKTYPTMLSRLFELMNKLKGEINNE